MMHPRIKSIDGMKRRAIPGEGGCLIWQGALTHNGYGRANFNGMPWRAHRLAWTLANGPIPDGLQVLHRCDVRACIEPSHLFLGTHWDNMADMDAKGRRAPQPIGERGYRAKLTLRGALALIRVRERDGLSVRALGRLAGISKSQAHRIVTGEQWGHLSEGLASA